MLRRIRTPLFNLSTNELLKGAETGYPEAKIELILRSPYTNNNLINKKTALSLCKELVLNQPSHNLANYIFALDAIETEKAKVHHANYTEAERLLLISIHAKGPCDQQVNGAAAFSLAKLHWQQKNIKKAMAWFTKALLLGSQEAQQAFLNNSFLPLSFELPAYMRNTLRDNRKAKRSTWAIHETILLMVLLSGGSIATDTEQFKNSRWYNYWNDTAKQTFLALQTENMENAFLNSNAASANVINWAINNDPNIFFRLLSYCVSKKIIADDLYIKLMCNYFLPIVPDPRLKDQANYNLFKIYLSKFSAEYNKTQNTENLDIALAYLTKISPVFNEYQWADLKMLSQHNDDEKIKAEKEKIQDEIIFTIFMKLRTGNDHRTTWNWVQKITRYFAIYDERLLEFFKKADPNENNYETYKIKKKLVNNIHSALILDQPPPHSVFTNADFNQSIIALQNRLNGPAFQIRTAIRSSIQLLEEYLAERNKRKALHPFRFFPGDFFKGNGKKRAEYVQQAKIFGEFPLMYDQSNYFADDLVAKDRHDNQFQRADYRKLYKDFHALMQWGKEQFAPGTFSHEMQNTFTKIEQILKDAAIATGINLREENLVAIKHR